MRAVFNRASITKNRVKGFCSQKRESFLEWIIRNIIYAMNNNKNLWYVFCSFCSPQQKRKLGESEVPLYKRQIFRPRPHRWLPSTTKIFTLVHQYLLGPKRLQDTPISGSTLNTMTSKWSITWSLDHNKLCDQPIDEYGTIHIPCLHGAEAKAFCWFLLTVRIPFFRDTGCTHTAK